MQLTHLSLFTGIAGFELTFKLADLPIQTVGYCEIDEYCQEVIKARIRDGYLDDAPIFPDICTFPCDEYQGLVDIITGGFPCQDLSTAGRGAGIHGERSGLWWEMQRCISEIRSRYVFLENVPAILARGLDEVIGSLAELGYDCEWGIVSAADVGAPHLRKRWWCMAYASGVRLETIPGPWEERARRALFTRCRTEGSIEQSQEMGNACELERARHWETWGWGRQSSTPGWWRAEPTLGRVANGVPNRVGKLRALGNAIVPAVAAEFLARIA